MAQFFDSQCSFWATVIVTHVIVTQCYVCDTTFNLFLFSAVKDIGQDFSMLNCHNVLVYNLNEFLFYAAINHTAVTVVYLCVQYFPVSPSALPVPGKSAKINSAISCVVFQATSPPKSLSWLRIVAGILLTSLSSHVNHLAWFRRVRWPVWFVTSLFQSWRGLSNIIVEPCLALPLSLLLFVSLWFSTIDVTWRALCVKCAVNKMTAKSNFGLAVM